MNANQDKGKSTALADLPISDQERGLIQTMNTMAPVMSLEAKQRIARSLGLVIPVELSRPEGFDNGGEVPLMNLTENFDEFVGWYKRYTREIDANPDALSMLLAIQSAFDVLKYLAKSNKDLNMIMANSATSAREIAHNMSDPNAANYLTMCATLQEMISEINEISAEYSPKPAPANVAEFSQSSKNPS